MATRTRNDAAVRADIPRELSLRIDAEVLRQHTEMPGVSTSRGEIVRRALYHYLTPAKS